MGDVVALHRPGSQSFMTLTVPCPCPCCGGPLRWINATDRVGHSMWERGVQVACATGCGWAGHVIVTLNAGPGCG